MRKLLEFLIGKRHWFLFCFLEIVSCILLFYNQDYHRNLIFGSSNTVVAQISSISGRVRSYLGLRDENKALLNRTGNYNFRLSNWSERSRT